MKYGSVCSGIEAAMRRKGATIAITIGAAVLALAGGGTHYEPIITPRLAQSFFCECVTIECQVCPDPDTTTDLAWCEDRGYLYVWNGKEMAL